MGKNFNLPGVLRKRRLILILSVFFILLSSLFIKPLIVILAKKQLGEVFVQSRISVAGCSLRPANRISFFDMEIKRQGVYDIKVKEAGIQYDLFALLSKRSLPKLSLKKTDVYLNTPQKGIRDFTGYFNLGRSGPQILSYMEISNLRLDLNTQDLCLKATLSSGLNLIAQSLEYLDFKMDFFKFFGAQVANASFKFEGSSKKGDFNIPQLKYDKLSVSGLKGRMKFEGMILSLYEVSAKILEGDIEGGMDLKIGKEIQYSVNLKCAGLDIERFVRDFNLGEKFNMSGKLTGNFKLQGTGARMEILGGDFSTLPSGGTLVIRDMKFLENMARNTGQPVDLLVESFKNYTYNTGMLRLGLTDNDIVLKIELEGQAGKRELNVILHDFRF